jgi:hypothetical protein
LRDWQAQPVDIIDDHEVLTGVTHGDGVRAHLERAGIPVVETWDVSSQPIDMVVGFDNEQAGAAVAAYLLRKGHRKLAYIGANEERSLKRGRPSDRQAMPTPLLRWRFPRNTAVRSLLYQAASNRARLVTRPQFSRPGFFQKFAAIPAVPARVGPGLPQ